MRKFYSVDNAMLDYKSELRGLPAVIIYKTEMDSIEEVIVLLELVRQNADRGNKRDFNKVNKMVVIPFSIDDEGNIIAHRKVNANDRMEKDEEQYAKALRKMGNTHLMLSNGTKLFGNAPNYSENAVNNLLTLLKEAKWVTLDELDDDTRLIVESVEESANVIYERNDEARELINAAQQSWHAAGRSIQDAALKSKKAEKKEAEEAAVATVEEPVATEAADELAAAFEAEIEDALDEADTEYGAPDRLDEDVETPAVI